MSQAVSQEHGLEGVVAKRLSPRYEPGRRSPSWLKIKNIRRQEVVIGGWKPGEGGRAGGIGSLLVGVQEADGLVYAGTSVPGSPSRRCDARPASSRRCDGTPRRS